ncbi:hypothetical protein N7532_004158 [Penicillium argentinense]|uniref:Uncharacterized protein n=1 Tax=Penicillium argentinense TaxID=1131581 RepID=A0A9W9FNU8_9EURO|nr:uncharacterized protein N7532_004158 [Penicillium argentinense]KAJ5103629.1 hypothetical protein N7532_004158 [Penicillium argentinense]
MVEGLTRYHSTRPSGVTVVHDRQALNDLVKLHPETILHTEKGGYYLKNMDEEVVAITHDDHLCIELDAAFASIDASNVGDDTQDGGSGSYGGANFTKRNEDLACYPDCLHNYCSHPRCYNSAHCLSYTSCHVCSSSTRKVCM